MRIKLTPIFPNLDDFLTTGIDTMPGVGISDSHLAGWMASNVGCTVTIPGRRKPSKCTFHGIDAVHKARTYAVTRIRETRGPTIAANIEFFWGK